MYLATWSIDSLLRCSVGMNGRHQTLLYSKFVIQDFGHWRKAVGCARCIAVSSKIRIHCVRKTILKELARRDMQNAMAINYLDFPLQTTDQVAWICLSSKVTIPPSIKNAASPQKLSPSAYHLKSENDFLLRSYISVWRLTLFSLSSFIYSHILLK